MKNAIAAVIAAMPSNVTAEPSALRTDSTAARIASMRSASAFGSRPSMTRFAAARNSRAILESIALRTGRSASGVLANPDRSPFEIAARRRASLSAPLS